MPSKWIVVALSFALLCDKVVLVVHGEPQQRYQNMKDELYPLQFIPVSSVTTQINYTMWTPMNWTFTSIRRKNDTVPNLEYNAYLLSTTSSQSFRVLVPLMSSSAITATTATTTTTGKVANNHPNTIRIDKNHMASKPFQECLLRQGFTQLRRNHVTCNGYSRHYYSNTSLQRVTQQSENHHCQYAMNGGPFHPNGSPLGVVMVQNGTLISTDFGPNIGVGIATKSTTRNDTTLKTTTTTTTTYWVIGRMDNRTQVRSLGIKQFVTGFDWLVYNYSNIALYRNNTTGAIRASRSSIGITSDGRLLLLVTDGCEHWYVLNHWDCFFTFSPRQFTEFQTSFRHQGMTLTEVAELFLLFGAQYAVNMDGGSSSVMVHKSQTILNQPMCYYNAIIPKEWMSCERPVSTVICLS